MKGERIKNTLAPFSLVSCAQLMRASGKNRGRKKKQNEEERTETERERERDPGDARCSLPPQSSARSERENAGSFVPSRFGKVVVCGMINEAKRDTSKEKKRREVFTHIKKNA
jgi:hypothetical protein